MKDPSSRIKLRAFSLYLALSTALHLVWEFSHMPLYTLWLNGTQDEILFNGFHCSVGDAMIASAALLFGIVLGGNGGWPTSNWTRVSAITVASGLAYTAFSEWYNTQIRKTWAYSESMPLLPGTNVGLSPLAQWLIIPALALAFTYWRSIAMNAKNSPSSIDTSKGMSR